MRSLILAATLAVAACSPNSDALYATKAALTAAEKAATQYVRLPLCPQPTALCSDAAVSAKIKAADTLAYTAVQGYAAGRVSASAAAAAVDALIAVIPGTK